MPEQAAVAAELAALSTQRRSTLLWVIFLSCFSFGMITNVLGNYSPRQLGNFDHEQY